MKNYKKIDHFEPIAMKCTQEQFEDIRKVLEKYFTKNRFGVIGSFKDWYYLFNNYNSVRSDESLLTNRFLSDVDNEIVYNEWNSETFLKACGIVETEPTTEVRNSVLLKLADNNSYSEEILKKECPKLFEKKEIKRELGKWYISTANKNINSLFMDIGNYKAKGFFQGHEWTEDWSFPKTNELRLATPQEVETALKSEFEKQNYVKFNIYKFDVNSNILTGRDSFSTKEFELFKDGVFTDEFKTPTDIITIFEKYGKDKVQEYLNNAK